MKSTLKIVLAVALIAFCVLSTAVWTFFSTRYSHDFGRLGELESRVQGLESSVRDRWATRRAGLEIVSPDRSTESNSYALHLVSGTNGTQRFQIPLGKEYGRSVAAWVSEWKPRDEIAKFDQFDISPTDDGHGFEILAKPRAGETIDMKFVVSVLVQRFGEREEAQPTGSANAPSPHR